MGVFSFALIFFLYGGVSTAQDGPLLDLKTTIEKETVVIRDGKEVEERMPAGETGPGDVLVFNIDYVNTGNAEAVDAAIINPVPEGVIYILESAGGEDAEVTCSIDDGYSWHRPPVMVRIMNAEGKEETRPAAADQYTHVRWVIKKPVQPGISGRVSFKATVE